MNTESHFRHEHRLPLPTVVNRWGIDVMTGQAVQLIEPRDVHRKSIHLVPMTSLLSLLFLTILLAGCGYTVGNDFRQDIKTVAVPIFENKTNRRGIQFQLTEAVQQEITKRSKYRLAKGLEADTRLSGEIIGFRKDVLGETAQDDPRELQVSLIVKVRWEDLRTGALLAEQEMPLSPDQISITDQSEFAPELGQSLATAMDDMLHATARKIVNLMETPW